MDGDNDNDATGRQSERLGSGRVFMASLNEMEGDVWLHVTAPNGNKGSINLNKLQCGPITRKAFIDWGRSHIQNT